jgi:AAA domain-containing protein
MTASNIVGGVSPREFATLPRVASGLTSSEQAFLQSPVVRTYGASTPLTARFHTPNAEIEVVPLADIQPEPVSWLWHGYVALGKLSLLEGDPGEGKSTLTIALAAAVSAGRPLPDGTRIDPANVLLISYEDALSDTLVPRLLAAGADLTRCQALCGYGDELLSIPTHVAAIREVVEDYSAKLLVIDPLSAALDSTETNSYKDQDVRRALSPLARMAEETGIAVLVVRHLTKASTRKAILAGGASIGIAAAARGVLSFGPAPDDSDEKVLAVVKCSNARKAPSLRFRIDSHTLVGAGPNGEDVEAPRLVCLGATELTAEDMNHAREDGSEDRTAAGAACDFLTAALADGPRPSRDLFRDAAREHINNRTLQRALAKLGGTARREGIGDKHRSMWELPDGPLATRNPTRDNVRHIQNLSRVDDSVASGEGERVYTYEPGSAEELAFMARLEKSGGALGAHD